MKPVNSLKTFIAFELNSNHTILYKLDDTNNFIPLNELFVDKWNSSYVRMPCSPLSFYPIVKDGKKSLSQRWRLIKDELKSIPNDIYDIKKVILSYNSRFVDTWNFEALFQLFESELNISECDKFFNVTYPGMVELVLNLPTLVTESIPLLKAQHSHGISMTQLQIASLLANAFFCTFPRRNSKQSESEFKNYPVINFSSLFSLNKTCSGRRKIEKLKCILNYFHRVITERPDGVVTFTRRFLSNSANWQENYNDFKTISLEVNNGSIFSYWNNSIKIDFANKFPGGGVLNNGCVQEEILFLTHPELIVSCLFTEKLGDQETLLVQGVQQYSLHTGYADSFRFKDGLPDNGGSPVQRDGYGRLKTVVSMVDAVRYCGQTNNQFEPEQINRELNKALCGFSDDLPWTDSLPNVISTGNWGCGAFGGDYQLKFLIQIMVCASIQKHMIYYTFDDEARKDEITAMFRVLQDSGSTVGRLWSALEHYHPGATDRTVFQYIQDSLSH